MGFRAEFRVPYAVLAHCLRGDRFSIVGLLNDMAFFQDRPDVWLRVIKLCGKGEGSLNLWWQDGDFLPCRENAAKAIAWLGRRTLSMAAKNSGYQDIPALVEAINALPPGLEWTRAKQPAAAQ